MRHVIEVEPDIIKVDRSLVAGIEGDRGRRSAFTTFVLLALDGGAVLVPEGSETLAGLETGPPRALMLLRATSSPVPLQASSRSTGGFPAGRSSRRRPSSRTTWPGSWLRTEQTTGKRCWTTCGGWSRRASLLRGPQEHSPLNRAGNVRRSAATSPARRAGPGQQVPARSVARIAASDAGRPNR